MASSEIHSVQTVSGNQPRVRRIIEDATQTFLNGTPVMLHSTNGAVKVWDGSTLLLGIAGFVNEPASNLTTAGVAKTLSYGSVPYQASAQNIPMGAPLNDGRIGFEVANDDTVFRGQVGPSQSVTAANVGIQYGMTLDSDGHWYVDTTKTTVNAVCVIVKIDPQDQSSTPRGVYFRIINTSQQLGS